MSYIRSTNNPEALYIWGDEKTAYIQMGYTEIGSMPISVLNGLIKRYIKNHHEDSRYGGAKICEVQDVDGNFKMQLSYDNWNCLMWGVTWDYIAMSNIGRIIKRENFFKSNNKLKIKK